MKRVVAIIQARCDSARLSGKVLMKLAGKPIIWHVIERLRRVRLLDDIVVATTVGEGDDKLTSYLKSINIKYFRGPEDDVLDRFIKAAVAFRADIIVRICSDSPLIEPAETDKMIIKLIKDNADYVLLRPGLKCMHEGFEVVTIGALKKQLTYSNANYVKEHVTIYIREKPEKFKVSYYAPAKEFQREGFRLSIDTLADLRFMQKIYRRLYREGRIVDLKKVIRFLDKHPEIKRINEGVKQRRPHQRYKRILIKTEAGRSAGLKYLGRALALGKYLGEGLNHGVFIGINKNNICRRIMKKEGKGINCEFINTSRELIDFSNRHRVDILVLDVSNIGRYNLLKIREKTAIKKIVLIGKVMDRPAADLCIMLSPPPGGIEKSWSRKENIILKNNLRGVAREIIR